MIATLVLLYHEFTLPALPKVQVVLKEINLVGVTITCMLKEETLSTERLLTFIANEWSILEQLNSSFTIL